MYYAGTSWFIGEINIVVFLHTAHLHGVIKINVTWHKSLL